jgi:hypothetical protein
VPRTEFNPSNEGFRQQWKDPDESQRVWAALNQLTPDSIEKQKEKDFSFLEEYLVKAMNKEIGYVLWGSAALALAALCLILI